MAQQLLSSIKIPHHYASADEPVPKERLWIELQWEIARMRSEGNAGILVLDEIQKIPGWSETVKRLWDEDSLN